MKEDLMVVRPGGPMRGELGASGVPNLPGDKSLSHRAALFAALAGGESRVENFLVSGVTDAMLGALASLGIRWQLNGLSLRIAGVGLDGLAKVLTGRRPVIDCSNSGTTMRLLAGALAAWNIPAVLDGSPGLRRRPMRRISEPMRQMGIDIGDVDGHAPLDLRPGKRPLQAIDYTLPVASAQVKSCLLLAALAADGETALREPGPSRDHSEHMLRAMGVEVVSERVSNPGAAKFLTRIRPPKEGQLTPLEMTLPGDISAASFLIVAALITPGSVIKLSGVGLNPTRTGLLDALLAMGADLQIENSREQGGEPVGDLTVRHSQLGGVRVDGQLVVRMIDEFPVFAVAAAYAEGITTVVEAAELRLKESDRISALCGELCSLGVAVEEQPDGFIIQGGRPPCGGRVNPHGDHRLAMSLAVAGLAAQGPVQIEGAAIVGESFPAFAPILAALGADISLDAG